MRIEIEALSFEAIIGLLEVERLAPQRVVVDAVYEYRYRKERFIDYARVCAFIEQIVQDGKFALIEEALAALSTALLQRFPDMEYLYLKIAKPDIIDNCTVSAVTEYRA